MLYSALIISGFIRVPRQGLLSWPCCPRGGAARAGRAAKEKRGVGRMRCAHGRVMVAGEGQKGVSLSRKLYEKQPFRFSCSDKTHRSLSVQNAVLPPPHRVGRPMIRASPRDDCLFARRIQSFRVANAIFSHGDYYLIARPKLRLGGAKRAFCSEEIMGCLCKLLIISWLVNCFILGVYALTVFFFQNNRGTRRFFSRFFMFFFPVGTNGRRGGSMGVCTAEGSMATVYRHGGGHGVVGRCA